MHDWKSIVLTPINGIIIHCYLISDINECLITKDNICFSMELCVNTEGDYECKCPADYKEAPDGKTCNRKYLPPYNLTSLQPLVYFTKYPVSNLFL